MLKLNSLYFSFCPLAVVMSLDFSEKAFALSLLIPQVFIHIARPPLSLLQTELLQLSPPVPVGQMFLFHYHICGLPLDLF